MPEPITTQHKSNVVIGTYFGDPWLYLRCTADDCRWRLGFDVEMDLDELVAAAARHEENPAR